MNTLRVEDLTGVVGHLSDYPKDFPLSLSSKLSENRKLWGMVLLLAVDDKATSVHYHPGRPDGELTYIVNNPL